MNQPNQEHITPIVELALTEDIGTGDISAMLIPKKQNATATVIARENAILCGQAWFDCAFKTVSDEVNIIWHKHDGDWINPNEPLCTISGPTRALVTAERTALNFLQTLSGTATVTAKMVKALEGTDCQLLDTRKTLPGMRHAQKYAVTCGGGKNHRLGLYDGFLLKENHLKVAESLKDAIERTRRLGLDKPIEVEVESLAELKEAIEANADIIMLDNFTRDDLKQAVAINQGQAKLEVSGNIQFEDIASIAQLGIDYISVGKLTKHVTAIDLSMRITEVLDN